MLSLLSCRVSPFPLQRFARHCSDGKMVRWTTGALSTVTSDTDFSVVATFDLAKYMFNCPENTTRASIQHKRGFRKMTAVFLTRIHTDTAMGLPGYLMSHADAMNTKMSLIGPQGLGLFLATTRTFATRSALELTVTEVATPNDEPCYKDSNLTVYAVPVSASFVEPETQNTMKRKREDESANYGATKVPRLDDASSLDRRPQERAKVRGGDGPWKNVVTTLGFAQDPKAPRDGNTRGQRNIPRWSHPLPLAVTYICVGPSFRGKFDVVRAKELGVEGRDRGRLTRGETVTLPNGTVVTPDMCVAPSTPSATFMVVDCPSPAYIDGLVTSAQFSKHRAGCEFPVHCIYYRLGDGVLQDERFRTWMSSFGPDVHHTLTGLGHVPDPVTFTSQASLLLRLNYLDRELFPLPQYSLKAATPITDFTEMSGNVHLLEPYQQILMHPPQAPESISRMVEDTFHPQHLLGSEAYLDQESIYAFDAAREAAKALPELPAGPGDDVIITTLGTASAAPSMYRNVMCNLVEIPGVGNILLDCGEGSWGQLVRKFGLAKMPDVLRAIRAVFISHNHGDHHIGLARVLSQRRRLVPNAEPLFLIATRITLDYLREFQRIEDIGIHSSVVPINNEDLRVDEWLPTTIALNRPAQPHDQHYARTQRSKEGRLQLLKAMRFTTIDTVFVKHRCAAYGIVMVHEDGWSLAFSGDTMPCEALVVAGQGVTLLIHEASMANDQEELAEFKGHSTFGQALEVARRMSAKNVLLTHFSSRYPKLAIRPKGAAEGGPVVGVAFDMATISIGAMKRLNRYLPVIESHFAETIEEGDVTAPGGDGAHIHDE